MENRFKKDAKDLVDTMFNTKFFKEDVTRDDMIAFEDLIEYLLQSRFDTYVKVEKFCKEVDKLK